MVHRGIVLVSYLCCALVIASFAMFVHDQVSGASKHQVAELASGAPTSAGSAAAAPRHSAPRRFIDSATKELTAPFRAVFQASSQWGRELFVTVCALLVYGLGLGYLARYSRGVS